MAPAPPPIETRRVPPLALGQRSTPALEELARECLRPDDLQLAALLVSRQEPVNLEHFAIAVGERLPYEEFARAKALERVRALGLHRPDGDLRDPTARALLPDPTAKHPFLFVLISRTCVLLPYLTTEQAGWHANHQLRELHRHLARSLPTRPPSLDHDTPRSTARSVSNTDIASSGRSRGRSISRAFDYG